MSLAVALDVRAAQSRTFGERGIARYVTEHALALARAGAPLAALVHDADAPAPARLAAGLAVHQGDLLVPGTLATWRRLLGPGAPPVAYHVGSPFESGRPVDGVLPPAALDGAAALVVTLYDCIPFALPGLYQESAATRRFLEARAALVRRADLVLAISEHARADGIRLLGLDPARVAVIGAGAAPHFSPAGPGDDPAAAVRAALPAVDRAFVLTVGGWDPRKNLFGTIDAYARLTPGLRKRHRLVIAGGLPPEAAPRLAERAAAAKLDPDEVVVTGRIDDVVLRDLYRAAALSVFPSLYEGFGLPVLEAARCGCPTITSATTSVPEVLDLPASTFEPTSTEGMAAAIDSGLTDAAHRAVLTAAAHRAAERHTWERVAERTAEAWAGLEPRRHRLPPSARPRVAVVGPYPPAVSGVATYHRALLPELATRCDATLFAERSGWTREPRAWRRLPVEALGGLRTGSSYDHVVSVLGNSVVHLATFERALQRTDVVWLHDLDLVALHVLAARRRPDPATWLAERLAVDPSGAAAAALVADPTDPDGLPSRADLRATGVRLVAEVAGAARGVVVNSALAAEVLAGELGPDGPPVAVVAHGHHPVDRPVTPEEPGLVVALGVVAPSRRPETLVEAFSLVPRSVLHQLVFVGPADPDVHESIRLAAHYAGVGDRVVVTGHVTDAAFDRWVARAAYVVQLRDGGAAESSGTVAAALGAGKVTVTSVPTARELPAGVVEVVDADVDAVELARVLVALAHDPDRRREMAEAAGAHARAWTFGDVAESLLAFLASLPPNA